MEILPCRGKLLKKTNQTKQNKKIWDFPPDKTNGQMEAPSLMEFKEAAIREHKRKRQRLGYNDRICSYIHNFTIKIYLGQVFKIRIQESFSISNYYQFILLQRFVVHTFTLLGTVKLFPVHGNIHGDVIIYSPTL